MTIPDEIKQWRKVQRTELLAKRVGKTPAQRRKSGDAAITRLLVEGFPLLQQMTVGFYWPFKSEFDPRFAIHHWRERGARAALPLVVEKFAPLQFREWWPGAPMTTGVYDLPFPDGTAVVVPSSPADPAGRVRRARVPPGLRRRLLRPDACRDDPAAPQNRRGVRIVENADHPAATARCAHGFHRDGGRCSSRRRGRTRPRRRPGPRIRTRRCHCAKARE